MCAWTFANIKGLFVCVCTYVLVHVRTCEVPKGNCLQTLRSLPNLCAAKIKEIDLT